MKKVAIVAGVVVGLATVAAAAYGFFTAMEGVVYWLGWRYDCDCDGVSRDDFDDTNLITDPH